MVKFIKVLLGIVLMCVFNNTYAQSDIPIVSVPLGNLHRQIGHLSNSSYYNDVTGTSPDNARNAFINLGYTVTNYINYSGNSLWYGNCNGYFFAGVFETDEAEEYDNTANAYLNSIHHDFGYDVKYFSVTLFCGSQKKNIHLTLRT